MKYYFQNPEQFLNIFVQKNVKKITVLCVHYSVSHSSTKYDFITLDKNLIRLPLYVLEIQVRYPLLQTIKVEVNQSDFVRAF